MHALTCAHHPGVVAELECAPCGVVLCRACARPLRDGRTLACSRCGGLVVPFRSVTGPISRAPQRAEAARPLLDRLPGTLLYLKQRSVLLVLLGLALLAWIGSYNLVLWLLSAGTQAAVFFRIVETTAFGDDHLETPDFTDLWDSVLSPLLRYLATFVPLIVLVFAAGLGLGGLALPYRSLLSALGPLAVAVLVWLALWPLLIMVAAISRSFVAILNPVQWWHVLADMRADYAIGALAFYATLLVDAFVFQPLAVRAMLYVPIPIVVPVLVQFARLILMAWRARILGEACRPYVE
jgi:hypothetical protein